MNPHHSRGCKTGFKRRGANQGCHDAQQTQEVENVSGAHSARQASLCMLPATKPSAEGFENSYVDTVQNSGVAASARISNLPHLFRVQSTVSRRVCRAVYSYRYRPLNINSLLIQHHILISETKYMDLHHWFVIRLQAQPKFCAIKSTLCYPTFYGSLLAFS